MVSYSEKELIKDVLNKFKQKSKNDLELDIEIKKLNIEEPLSTNLYKEFKNGTESTSVLVSLELSGWRSYDESGLENFLKSIVDEDDKYYPIVEFSVIEIPQKGKLTVNLNFSFVFTKLDIAESYVKDSGIKDNIDNSEIIREIELRLSEIYTLLTKLKKK